jgi:hypothetical protein
MGIDAGPIIASEGLVFQLDAANFRSYSGSGLTTYAIVAGIGATLVGGVGFTTSNNGALTFDGSNDYIDVNDFNFDFSGGLTICSFCRPTAASNWGRIVDFGLGQANENILLGRYSNSSNSFFIEVRNNVDFQRLIYSTGGQFVINQNHFLTGVVDGGTPGGGTNARLYYNGNQISTASVNSMIVPNTINRTNNYIARSNWTADAYYQGNIYSVLIYNRALSQQEILQNYIALKRRFGL